MVKHLRIDNRLIHGQVAATWKAYIDADAIIVCNDKVSKDPIQKMALPLAARGTKVMVYSIEETVQYANKHPEEILFIICKYPTDALEVLESGVDVEEVNVGNAAPPVGKDYVMVTKSIAVTQDDAVIYRKIAEMRGGKLTSQMVPTYEKSNFLDLMDKAGV